jgi:hypothetical protein
MLVVVASVTALGLRERSRRPVVETVTTPA